MDSSPDSFAAVIDLWPSAVEFSRDVNVKEVTGRSWKARGIPAEYWERVVAAAVLRKFNAVTLPLLARLAAARAEAKSAA